MTPWLAALALTLGCVGPLHALAQAPNQTQAPPAAADAEAALWAALRGPAADGVVLLMRHALAPGGGDPPGMRLGDCSTQRNLSDEGRAQARRWGQRLRAQQVPVQALWHSQWCRTRDTAELAFPGQGLPVPLFNSFFGQPGQEADFVAQARPRLAAWRGPGVLLVVTHQVNITALTGVFPASGELLALRFDGHGPPRLIGRLAP